MNNPLRFVRVVVCALVLCGLLPTQVFAQKVLILVAETPDDQVTFVSDVKGKLDATGRLTTVDVFDAGSGTPTAEQLANYDAVMTWPDLPFADRVLLGDRLADFVDHGHGVVQAVFSFDSDNLGATLGGRWETQHYAAFSNNSVSGMDSLTLVADVANHEILQGVSSVALSSGFFQVGAIPAPCATVVAHWSNGEPLVAVCAGPQSGRVVALNMYPPSTDSGFPFAWDGSTQGGLLMANALAYAGTAPLSANNLPVVDAGRDVTVEATGHAGATVTVTGTVNDPDGDNLTLAWTGTGLVGTGLSFTDTFAAPAGGKSVSYVLTLTVSDNKGGLASDDVIVTVTDYRGPVLSGVPAGVVTAAATSRDGAVVSYGSVAALDAVDGPRAVLCSVRSGAVFPIGDTPVTCSSVDSRGNSVKGTFTVRVQDVTVPGVMWGDGAIRVGSVKNEVEFAVGERGGLQGAWLRLDVTDSRTNRADHFVARATDFVAFSNNPAVHPGSSCLDTVSFSGTGDWNGHSGYRYEVVAVDKGQPGRPAISLRLTVKSATGVVVASVDGAFAVPAQCQSAKAVQAAQLVCLAKIITRRR